MNATLLIAISAVSCLRSYSLFCRVSNTLSCVLACVAPSLSHLVQCYLQQLDADLNPQAAIRFCLESCPERWRDSITIGFECRL